MPPRPAPPPVAAQQPARELSDHYIIDREVERREPLANQLLRVANGVLLLILVAVSLALFCLVALLLGIF